MTSIKLIVTGAKARAEVDGVLTSGAVGIPVTIEYDSTWDGLSKNLVCTSGKWRPNGQAKMILDVQNSATVANEVLIAENHLYLGVEGYNADGTLVIPTTWADCGNICAGVSMDATPAAKPTLPVWAQLQRQINELKVNGGSGGFYTPALSQPNDETLQFEFLPSRTDMPAVSSVKVTLPSSGSTEGVDLTGYVTEEELSEAIDDALVQAKESGAFDGATGATGATGPKGDKGDQGDTYTLTAADKTEIAEQVENATIVQAPKYVSSVDEMTDTDRPYVLIETGRIWANAETTVEKEVTGTDNITATDDNPYMDGNRLGGSGDGFSSDAAGYHVTPLIDLTPYAGKTIQLHLEGVQYASTGTYATWIQARAYGNDKSALFARAYTADVGPDTAYLLGNLNGITVEYNSATSATITINDPTYGTSKVPVGYLRLCGKGAVADSRIYITHQEIQTVTGEQWFDTGTTYTAALTDADKTEIADKVAAMVDAQLLSVIGDGTVTA